MKNLILLPIAFAVSLAAQAGQTTVAAEESPQRVYTYALSLDAGGGVLEVVPHGFAPDTISRKLETEIGGWIFEPSAASQGNEPTRTFLRVVVSPDKVDAGYSLVSATTGPAPLTLDQPEYPLNDQKRGNEGTVVLELRVATDGTVTQARVHGVSGTASRTMAGAALAAARDWTFMPEIVDGRAVEGTLLWPVCYLGVRSSVSSCVWSGPDAQRLSSKMVLTLDPAIRLVSPIALQ
jgi:protein TonB